MTRVELETSSAWSWRLDLISCLVMRRSSETENLWPCSARFWSKVIALRFGDLSLRISLIRSLLPIPDRAVTFSGDDFEDMGLHGLVAPSLCLTLRFWLVSNFQSVSCENWERCVWEREREVKGGTYRLIKVVKSERFAIETTYFSGAVLCSAFLKVLSE